MIEILTLFVGLYSGQQPVELKAAEPVATIELRLDGETLATLEEPPWTYRLDLGADLAPHELVAIGRDSSGAEVGRAQRWINRRAKPPRKAASVEPTSEGLTPVAVTLDHGQELPAENDFSDWFRIDGVSLEVVRVDEGPAELLIIRDPAIQSYLDRVTELYFHLQLFPERWEGYPFHDQQDFVASARETLLDIQQVSAAQSVAAVWKRWNRSFDFGPETVTTFISPRAAPISRIASATEVFNFTAAVESQQDGLLWHAIQTRPLHFDSRISDAVAMAGLEAHASQRRRSVLLLTSTASVISRYSPKTVRNYLEQLQVPFDIWLFAGEGPEISQPDPGTRGSSPKSNRATSTHPVTDWGEMRVITYPNLITLETASAYLSSLEAATRGLRQRLRRQRIFWLRGDHLPSRVQVAEEIYGVRVAGTQSLGMESKPSVVKEPPPAGPEPPVETMSSVPVATGGGR